MADSSNTQLLEVLRQNTNSRDLRESACHDMKKWRESLVDGKQSPEKISSLKKILLLLGSSGAKVSGSALENGMVSSKTVSAAENKMPIASYLSGHMGRAYIGLPEGEGKKH